MDGSRDLKYLMSAMNQARMSKARNKKVGAVAVKNNTIISTGFNGPPRGIDEDNYFPFFTEEERETIVKVFIDGSFRSSLWKDREEFNDLMKEFGRDPRYLLGKRSGEGLEYQLDVHAEANVIVHSSRMDLIGSTIYVYAGIPCKNCSSLIVNAGIDRVVCFEKNRPQTDEYRTHTSLEFFHQANVELDQYKEGEFRNYLKRTEQTDVWEEL